MPNKRLLIAAAVVLALILACAGSYLFWPRARDWADMQFDNIVRHHDNASRFGAANDALETTTIRHWVDAASDEIVDQALRGGEARMLGQRHPRRVAIAGERDVALSG